MSQDRHSWALGTRTAGSSVTTRLMRAPRSPDQALVDSALRDLLGSVLVHQLSGQHLAVVRAGRSAEGVHVDADERAVGTERRAGGDADDDACGRL